MYSNFRTLEGIGILKLVLLANGFAEFKIQKVDNEWQIIEKEEDKGKPRFVLHGHEQKQQKKRKLFVIFIMVLGNLFL